MSPRRAAPAPRATCLKGSAERSCSRRFGERWLELGPLFGFEPTSQTATVEQAVEETLAVDHGEVGAAWLNQCAVVGELTSAVEIEGPAQRVGLRRGALPDCLRNGHTSSMHRPPTRAHRSGGTIAISRVADFGPSMAHVWVALTIVCGS